MRNKTVYITLICVCVLYIFLVIYARYKDKKDVQKLGVTALPDNHKCDQYFYQIIVFTGHRKDAGTKSKVKLPNENKIFYFSYLFRFISFYRVIMMIHKFEHLLIQNDKFYSVVELTHLLWLFQSQCDSNPLKKRNFSFRSLGLLNYLHIWHDNSGAGASSSWFLKYIIVRDLQTMEKSYFICQKWFAVEKEDEVVSVIDFFIFPVKSILRLNVFYQSRVNIKKKNSHMSCPNKRIIVYLKVIFGFQYFLVHHRINLHVYNDVLVVLFYY
jgi:polycystin 1L2